MEKITIIATALGLGGCATVFNEKTQPINVSSSSGGEVHGTVNGTPFKGPPDFDT